MYFNKYPHPANFRFSNLQGRVEPRVSAYEGGLSRFRAVTQEAQIEALAELDWPKETKESALSLSGFSNLVLKAGKRTILDSNGKDALGLNGEAWMLRLAVPVDSAFYGLGEKTFSHMEVSGVRTKFVNTDVWGDFDYRQVQAAPTDPGYASVPYLILASKGTYVGILINSAWPAFFDVPAKGKERELILGAEGGPIDVVFLIGPSLAELTRKLQKLVGTTPLPPLWSLGYHQCRWGYKGEEDLLRLNKGFDDHDIPCDGIWLDIDYMNGYRIFTDSPEWLPNGIKKSVETLAKSGRRVVPILDPGVKQEPGYEVYDDGHKRKIFCLNQEGLEYAGLVWPGITAFPDFTMPEARSWWASRVKGMVDQGYGGFWVDMNDPSTGAVDPTGMLFRQGSEGHFAHRNEYALGMQRATREGMLMARPNERPFILSRSGSTGSSRYAALWTGDNISSYYFLEMSIPTSVNLALSGIPFNGPDLGGFGEATTEKLIVDWAKAGFLFPFCRNHNMHKRDQEPWVFSADGNAVLRKFIRLRYKLLPYLYQLFIAQEENGEAILRPLFYDFPEERGVAEIKDQFLVGPAVLQAPFVKTSRTRRAILPGKRRWLDARDGSWSSGKLRLEKEFESTPLFLRDGSFVPMQREVKGQSKEILSVDGLIVADPASEGSLSDIYCADDGLSFNYQKGERSRVEIRASWKGGSLAIETKNLQSGYKTPSIRFLIPEGFASATVNGAPAKIDRENLELAGAPFGVLALG